MIIDSHTHVGKTLFPVGKNRVSDLKEKDLLTALDKYGIERALVSNIGGGEFDSDSHLGPVDKQISQITVIEGTIDFVKRHPRRLKALLWVKPFTEGYDDRIEEIIRNNREFIAGLKIHPSLSNLPFTDERYRPYLELASRLHLPVQVHTENDGRSDVKYVHDAALAYSGIPFVMVHMGLDSDNSEAINLIKKTDNLYGDTCEVELRRVLNAIEVAGSAKILFGTDAVVHGVDTYLHYLPIIRAIQEKFPQEVVDNILSKNCLRVHGW